ncbi:hypothetical protein Dxin01_00069 [Deinococcus xinjiangensis]|uniref:Formate/nitrite transporter n=1 Tax=Deinococcus xinjiangensis TaxID=457454 RepID=A0ABP9V4Y8_9DEIO
MVSGKRWGGTWFLKYAGAHIPHFRNSVEKLAGLNWTTFFTHNLLPVTLGNIVGGALLVAGVYWFVYRVRPAQP